jgi:integrase/recombinase XerD
LKNKPGIQNQIFSPELTPFVRYLESERGHTPQGIRRYRYDVQLWLSWLAAQGQEANQEALRTFLGERSLSPRRTQGFMAALRAYYRWRQEVCGEVVEDPTKGVGRPRAGRRIPKRPSREDLQKLLSVLKGEPEVRLLSTFLPFLYGTGLRVSEALGLRLEHLILEQRRPVALRVIGKGDKERLVPLSPLAQQALEAWLTARSSRRGPLWVYQQKKYQGRPVGISWLQKKLASLALRAGLEVSRCSPHKFRHAYATELADGGVGLDAIKELLGHSYISTTQIYLHTGYQRLRQAVAQLKTI